MAYARGVWKSVFSNFHIEPDGTHVEGEFQAAKHDGHRIRQLVILRAQMPRQAKKLAYDWTLTEDELAAWNDRRVDVMLHFVSAKVMEWEYIRTDLLLTGEHNIVEFNNHHDNFWGDCQCSRPKCRAIGDNWLGETLMKVRQQWRDAVPRSQ